MSQCYIRLTTLDWFRYILDFAALLQKTARRLTPFVQLLGMYKTMRASRTVSNIHSKHAEIEPENPSMQSDVSSRAASIV
jgi:hypothetical protein